MLMPFGKFKGDSVDEIPADYLSWVWNNVELREPLRTHIELALFGGNMPTVDQGDLVSVYRQMAMKYHPDRGGGHEAMIAVNEFYRALRAKGIKA